MYELEAYLKAVSLIMFKGRAGSVTSVNKARKIEIAFDKEYGFHTAWGAGHTILAQLGYDGTSFTWSQARKKLKELIAYAYSNDPGAALKLQAQLDDFLERHGEKRLYK